MRETQRAYGEGYAPETDLREGSGWQAPSRQGPPTPCRSRKSRATARPGPGMAAYAALCLVLALPVAVGLFANTWMQKERDWRARDYCAAVYAGKTPDWRRAYFEQCAGPVLKKPRS